MTYELNIEIVRASDGMWGAKLSAVGDPVGYACLPAYRSPWTAVEQIIETFIDCETRRQEHRRVHLH